MPIKRLANLAVSNVDKKSVDGEVPVRLCNYTDVYYNATITPELDFMAATATDGQIAQFALRAGDTVFTKDSETADDIAVPAFVPSTLPGVVCGYHLAIARPRPGLNPRFMYWALASQPIRQQMALAATGVTRFGLRQDLLGNVDVPLPPADTQRTIADFLDSETARIDRIISSRTRQRGLYAARFAAAVDRVVLGLGRSSALSRSPFFAAVPVGWTETTLRHLGYEVQTGPFGSQLHADEYIEGGWPVVNPMNLVAGRIEPTERMSVSDAKRDELARHVLEAGDIVFGRPGELGRAGYVEEGHVGWLCGTGSLRLRKRQGLLDSSYLKVLLETAALKSYFKLQSVGSTMDNLNAEILLAMPCLVPPVGTQAEIVADVRRLGDAHARLDESIVRQVALLQEHRQALIIAAVTGQLDVAREIAEEAS